MTSLTLGRRAFEAPARRRWYLAAFVLLAATFYAMALTSPQGAAESAVFLCLAQLAALSAGLAVYVRVAELPVAETVAAEAIPGPRVGRAGLQESLAAMLTLAEASEREMAVAVMLIEPDQALSTTRTVAHAFERLKLALRTKAGRAEVIELSESCLALTLAGASASYDLELIAHSLLRDLRDVQQNEWGLSTLNLTFGIGVCAGERASVEGLLWQARVALRRAYDLNTGIYVVSNRSNLAGRVQ